MGGGTEGKRIPQAMKMGLSETVKPKVAEIAGALCARDYKGPANLGQSTVVMYESESKECD